MEKFNFSIETFVSSPWEEKCIICQRDLLIKPPLSVFQKEFKPVCSNWAKKNAPELYDFMNSFYHNLIEDQRTLPRLISIRYVALQRPTECFHCKNMFSPKAVLRCTDSLGRPLCFICVNKKFPSEFCRLISRYVWDGYCDQEHKNNQLNGENQKTI